MGHGTATATGGASWLGRSARSVRAPTTAGGTCSGSRTEPVETRSLSRDNTNREIVERYFAAYPSDWETMGELRHPDFVEDWPQSGERIVGHENYRAIHENYPGGTPGSEIDRIVGTEDRLV